MLSVVMLCSICKVIIVSRVLQIVLILKHLPQFLVKAAILAFHVLIHFKI